MPLKFDALTPEIQQHIISFTDRNDKKNLRLVNRSVEPNARRELINRDRIVRREQNARGQELPYNLDDAQFSPEYIANRNLLESTRTDERIAIASHPRAEGNTLLQLAGIAATPEEHLERD